MSTENDDATIVRKPGVDSSYESEGHSLQKEENDDRGAKESNKNFALQELKAVQNQEGEKGIYDHFIDQGHDLSLSQGQKMLQRCSLMQQEPVEDNYGGSLEDVPNCKVQSHEMASQGEGQNRSHQSDIGYQSQDPLDSDHAKCVLLSDVILTTMDVLFEELVLCGELQRVEGATWTLKRQHLVEFLINFYRTYNEKLEELTTKLKQLDVVAAELSVDNALTEKVSFEDNSCVQNDTRTKKRRLRSTGALKQTPDKVKDICEVKVIGTTQIIQESELEESIKQEVDEEDLVLVVPQPLQCESETKGKTKKNKSETITENRLSDSDTDFYYDSNISADTDSADDWQPELETVPPKKKRKIKNPQPVAKKRTKPLSKLKIKREIQKKSLKAESLVRNKLKKPRGVKNLMKNVTTKKGKMKKETKAKKETNVALKSENESDSALEESDNESESKLDNDENETESRPKIRKLRLKKENNKTKMIMNNTKFLSLNNRSNDVQEDDAEDYEKLPMTLKIHEVRDIDIYFKVRSSNPVTFMCRVCAHQTPTQDLMTEHIHIHTGERPYVCPICDRSYIRKKHLRRHELSHTGVKPNRRKNYQCDLCSRAFDCKSKLIEHRAGHTGEKPHQCNLCEFATRFSKNLRNHMDVMHPSEPRERKYMCKICNRAYLSHNTLRAHIKDCHDTEVHICEVCGKNFGSWSGLREHYLSHKDRVYQCPYCEFRTNRPKTLKVHKTKHFDRRIQCDMCGKILRSIASLKNHLKVMHGPNSAEGKVFSCLFCGATYDGRRKMSAHMRKHKRKLTQQGSKDAEFAMTHFVAIPKNSTLEHNTGKKPTQIKRTRAKKLHSNTATASNSPAAATSSSGASSAALQAASLEQAAIAVAVGGQSSYNDIRKLDLSQPGSATQDYSSGNNNSKPAPSVIPRLPVVATLDQESGTCKTETNYQDMGTMPHHHQESALLNTSCSNRTRVNTQKHDRDVINARQPTSIYSGGNVETTNINSVTRPTGGSVYSHVETHTARMDRNPYSRGDPALNRSDVHSEATMASYNRPDINNVHNQDSNLSRPGSAYNGSEGLGVQPQTAITNQNAAHDGNSPAIAQSHDLTLHQLQQRHVINIQPRINVSNTTTQAGYHRNEAIMNRTATSMMNARPDVGYNRPIMMSHDHLSGHHNLETIFPSPSPYMSPWVPSGYPNYHPP